MQIMILHQDCFATLTVSTLEHNFPLFHDVNVDDYSLNSQGDLQRTSRLSHHNPQLLKSVLVLRLWIAKMYDGIAFRK